MKEYIAFWKGYLDFSGVASRRAYWTPTIINLILFLLTAPAAFILASDGVEPLTVALIVMICSYVIAAVMPDIALQIRRLHDVNRSGFWILLTFVPVVGDVILLVFYLMPSVVAGNRYR
jgi:uncharacterized membrane protein YhaH (DUF805 family)